MTYTSEHVVLNILDNGDWRLTLDGVLYLFQWFGSWMRVTGPDTCYWIYEIANKMEMAGCSLVELSVMVSKI